MRVVLLLLVSCVVLGAAAQKRKMTQTPEWDFRNEAERGSRGCANLTLVLDNWKFAIMTQVKDLLLHDHSTVLPDYGRIQALSDALGDLYKEFNTLKERLVQLTAKFEGVEAFVDDARSGRGPRPLLLPREVGAAVIDPAGAPQRKRTRVVVRKLNRRAVS